MKLLRHIINLLCIATAFLANAAEQLTAKAEGAANQPTAAELKLLQGTWEGFLVGHEADGKIIITITGNSLHFHRDTKFWFETIITLPAGTDPQQLHATIKDCAPPTGDSIGKVVFAIFKIADGTLTLETLTEDDMADKRPKTFANASNRYVLKQVQPQKKNIEPPEPKEPKTP